MESCKKPISAKMNGGPMPKSDALKKFIKIVKNTPSPTQPTPALPDTVHLKEKCSLQMLSLKDKSELEMLREMNIKRHVRIRQPLRPLTQIVVQKERPNRKSKRKRVSVLRPADPHEPDYLFTSKSPKIGFKVNIPTQSILRKMNGFLTETETPKLLQKTRRSKYLSLALCAPPREERALANWDLEMRNRKTEQSRLTDILKRPARSLLMARVDLFRRQNMEEYANQMVDDKALSDACFWSQPPSFGSKQIMTTLTKTERGRRRTPVLYGDGEIMNKEKGHYESSIHETDYFKSEHDRNCGVIHIANYGLFNKLEVIGHAALPPNQANAVTDNAATKPALSEGVQDIANLKKQNSCQILGPSLCIDGATLNWKGNTENQRASITKETFVLIEAKVGEIVKSHMTLENNGPILLKYFWKKEPVFHPLPIRRPIRRPFYCFDDAGSILPGEIIHVPVLFRSLVPGYFTESWLLDTVPILENGAKIKFTLKGVAKEVKDFTRQRLEIEEYIRRKQVETLCHLEAKFILDSAISKACYESQRLPEDPICLTGEAMFEEANPGFYHHRNVIKDLWVMFDIVSKDTNTTKTEDSVLCVSKLRDMIVNFPIEHSVEEGDDDYDQTNILFNKFCRKMTQLSFRPLTLGRSDESKNHMVMHTLLQTGLDRFTSQAYRLAETLHLVVVEKSFDIAPAEIKQKAMRSGSQRLKSKTTESIKSKNKDSKEASPTQEIATRPVSNVTEDPNEAPQFSPVAKYRQTNANDSGGSSFDKYEERTYIMMYEMLLDTMEAFYQLVNG